MNMNMQELVDRHSAFWRCEGKAPLVNILPLKVWAKKPYPVRENEFIRDAAPLRNEDFSIPRMVTPKDTPGLPLAGELIQPIGCVFPEAWMEGMIGCPIYATENSCSAKPISEDVQEVLDQGILPDDRNPWFQTAAELLRCCGREYPGLPVRQIHMRGVIDMLAASLGEASLCVEMMDESPELEKLGALYRDYFIRTANTLFPLRQPWMGGYVSTWKIYAPGKLLDYQIDASNLFSVEQYARHFLDYDRAIIDSFPYSITHVHNCSIRHVDSLLTLQNLGAIEINLDRESGELDFDRLYWYANKIQQCGKGVVLVGRLTEQEQETLLGKVSVKALAIDCWREEQF